MLKKSITILAALGVCGALNASSHREAPGITSMPKVDASDFYMFNSYEAGREGYVTLVACYLPLQDPFGGPNYFFLDDEAIYEIHIDSNGDGVENLTFQFDFTNSFPGLQCRSAPARTSNWSTFRCMPPVR